MLLRKICQVASIAAIPRGAAIKLQFYARRPAEHATNILWVQENALAFTDPPLRGHDKVAFPLPV